MILTESQFGIRAVPGICPHYMTARRNPNQRSTSMNTNGGGIRGIKREGGQADGGGRE